MFNFIRIPRNHYFPLLAVILIGLLLSGIEKGEIFRIIYVHVPYAWISMMALFLMGIMGIIYVITKNEGISLWIRGINEVGIIMTGLTLMTGSIWGRLTWGTYWVWDSRLTLEVIIFIYFLLILNSLRKGEMKRVSYVMIIGLIQIPLVKWSVEWWTSIHQGGSMTMMTNKVHEAIGIPLIIWMVIIIYYVVMYILIRVRTLALKGVINRIRIRE